MLRLRWTYQGQGYSFAMGLSDTPINRAAAEAKAAEIQIDIALDQFDRSLRKYNPQTPDVHVLDAKLFGLFIEWKRANGISQTSAAARYRSLKNHLARFGTVSSVVDADRLMAQVRKNRNANSGNQALFCYREFGRWAVAREYVDKNPFADLPTVRSPGRGQNHKRRPFTLDEVQRILDQFAQDEWLSYYHDFVLFMFSLGVRPSEAVGLRWASVDLASNLVTISEAVVRINSSGKPIRKGTKNGVVRTLQLTAKVAESLAKRQVPDQAGDDLIFPAPLGGYINTTTFLNRFWRRACNQAQVPYRPLYTTRHTLISYGLEMEGWTLPQAAQVAGDTVSTIAKHYAHAIEPPSMPDF